MATQNPRSIYEDNHLLIVDKPAGWLVQGDQTGDRTLTDWAKDYIKEKYDKPGAVFLNPVHRIDRPVSGIVVFARTSKALERMNKLFKDQEIQKTYLTIVDGRPDLEEETLVHWLVKNEKKNRTNASDKASNKGKRSELSYELLAHDKGHSFLRIKPKTGRPHQIRVQLAKVGCSIQGDLKYGYPNPNRDKSISLHNYKISFIHPVKKEPVTFKSKPNWPLFNHFMDDLD